MLNVITIIGRFSAVPELKTSRSGKSVTSFTLANKTGYGDNEKTNWINCVAWEKTAEIITKNFTKGSRICILGELQTRQYEDKNGNKRTAVEVIVRNIEFVDLKSESPKEHESFSNTGAEDFNDLGEVIDDDLPF